MDFHSKTALASLVGTFAGLLVLIGSAGPWAKVWFITVSGLDGDGMLTVFIGLLAGILLTYRAVRANSSRWPAIIGLVAFTACFAIGLYDQNNIQGLIDQSEAESNLVVAQVGWGLYLVIIGSIIGMLASLAACFGHHAVHHQQEPILGVGIEN